MQAQTMKSSAKMGGAASLIVIAASAAFLVSIAAISAWHAMAPVTHTLISALL